jgi:hypothetical protein
LPHLLHFCGRHQVNSNIKKPCSLLRAFFRLKFFSDSRRTRPRKMALVANAASSDVDSAQTLKMCSITIFNRFCTILQTGSLFCHFRRFFDDSNFNVIRELLGLEKWHKMCANFKNVHDCNISKFLLSSNSFVFCKDH